MKLKILQASFHRNGVCGEGFTAILFEDHEGSKEDQPMIASLFDEAGVCAVYSVPKLAEGNIGFAMGNSWRGDRYEEQLRPLLNRVGPFALPPEVV